MRPQISLFVVCCLAAALPGRAEHSVAFKVVVAADHEEDSISRERLGEIFRKRIAAWEDGTPVEPIDQAPESPVREAFSAAVHGKSVTAIESYWQRYVLSQRGAPPPAVESDEEVLAVVETEPGAVGYVASETRLGPGARVLHVTGLEGYDAAALSGPRQAGDGERPAADDETVSRHGDLRLFLTGSCGPGGRGRRAVLENRSAHDALGARIETSTWIDGWFHRGSSSHHTLAPLAEEPLGCTRRPDDAEQRYAILQVSSAATRPPAPHAEEEPARSMIGIVAAGTCGLGRAGQTRTLVNRHPWREVAVAVQVREESGGQLRRSYRKDHRLAPGVSRRLGCDADGDLERTFTVLEAEYR